MHDDKMLGFISCRLCSCKEAMVRLGFCGVCSREGRGGWGRSVVQWGCKYSRVRKSREGSGPQYPLHRHEAPETKPVLKLLVRKGGL
jgi:hypothetical protein